MTALTNLTNLKPKHIWSLAALSLLLALTNTLLSPHRVSALAGDPTGVLPSGTGWLNVTWPGSNGMEAPSMSAYAYVPGTGSSFDMRIENACDATTQDQDPNNLATIFSISRAYADSVSIISGNGAVLPAGGNYNPTDHWITCNSGSDISIRVNLASSVPTQVINGATYRRVMLVASATGSASSYYSNRFKFREVTSGVRFGFTWSGSRPSSNRGYTGIAYDLRSEGWGWSTQLTFAEPCGSSGASRQVFFFDTDHKAGTSSASPFWQHDNQTMNYYIESFNRQSGLSAGIVAYGTLKGGNGVVDATEPFTTSPNLKYQITVSNINYVNSIQIALPLPPAAALDTCPTNSPPSGSLTISCNPNNAVLTVGANVTDANGGTLTVTANITGGATPPSLSGSRVGSGTLALGTSQGRYGVTHTVTGTVRDSAGATATLTGDSEMCPPLITIRGTVRNAYNPARVYAGVTINTCRTGVLAVTRSDGTYSFTVPQGQQYCVRVAGNPAGSVDTRVRPLNAGYANCSQYSLAQPYPTPNYCAGHTSYECQIAGGTSPSCTSRDRTSDSGADFALRFRPVIACTVAAPSAIEIGAGQYTPVVQITNVGLPDGARPIASGTNGVQVTVVIPGPTPDPTRQGSYAGLNSTPVTATMPAITIPAAGRFDIEATARATADGLDASPNPIACSDNVEIIVGNKSYLKSYGGEVWAGGSWPATQAGGGYAAGYCDYDPDNGRIHAFAAQANSSTYGVMQYLGSGTQFTAAAFLGITGALGGDEGFSSASTRTPGAGNTWAPKGLTIANNTAGYSGRSHIRHCMTNYYDDTVDTAVPVATSITAANTAGGRQRVMLSGDQTLNGFTVNNNSQIAVYVDGDVYINGNIALSDARTTQAQLPYFALIVRGNIFIAPGVTRLDGLYIAQPSSVRPNLASGVRDNITDGVIYTCANSFSFVPANSLYSICNRQLVVNGSLIADQIRWLRSFETMSNGGVQEKPLDFGTGTGTKAAEVINYTPEMYLAPSPLKNPADGPADSSADAYDSITTMPPVY